MNWTPDRCEELEKLVDLLRECCAIDKSTGVIARLKRIEEMAAALSKAEIGKGRVSFPMFLTDLAIAERSAK